MKLSTAESTTTSIPNDTSAAATTTAIAPPPIDDAHDTVSSGIVPVPASIKEAAEAIVGHASRWVTVLQILCNVVGGAVLALPSGFQRMSFFPAVLFLTFISFMSWFAVTLVAKACARTGLYTFQDLVIHASNNNTWFVRFFFFGLLVFPLGIIVAFMKVIGDSMPEVAKYMVSSNSGGGGTGTQKQTTSGGGDMWLQEWFWLLVATIVLIPLCSFRQMSELVWVSIIGFGTVLFTGLSVVWLFLSGRYTKHYNPHATPSMCVDAFRNSSLDAQQLLNHSGLIHPGLRYFSLDIEDFFVAFSTMVIALTCHNNVPFFYGELRRRSEERMMQAVHAAGYVSTFFYLAVGITGYFVFGPSIALSHGNVLNCGSWDDGLVMLCRVLMSLHFVCVYPVNCICARRVLNRILFPEIDESKMSQLKLTMEATILVGLSAIVAFEASGIEAVFSINGSLFGLLLTFALPAFCYIRLVNPCALDDLWTAKRGALETSSVGSDSDEAQELGDVAAVNVAAGSTTNSSDSEGEDSDSTSGSRRPPRGTAMVSSSSEEDEDDEDKKNKDDDEDDQDGGELHDRQQQQQQSRRRNPDALDIMVTSASFAHVPSGVQQQGQHCDTNKQKALRQQASSSSVGSLDRIPPAAQAAQEDEEPQQQLNNDSISRTQQPTHHLHHHHHHQLADFTAPREVRERSSLTWRISVWFMLILGVLGSALSFVFSMHAIAK